MKVEPTSLEGVRIITLDAFDDDRGQYVETYNEALYRQQGIDVDFIQDDISVSRKHVLRGIHGDPKTWKLISCLYGEFYLVVVNADEASPQYREWEAFTLSDARREQILVPPKHGNGHLVLSDTAIFHYKQSTYYDPASQFTYLWNDSELGITWPVENPVLSKRDSVGHFVKEGE